MNLKRNNEIAKVLENFKSTEYHLKMLKHLKKYPGNYGYCYCHVCSNEECTHIYQLGEFHPSNDHYCVCGECLKKYYNYTFEPLDDTPKNTNKNTNLSMRFRILERDGFKCVYCGRSPNKDNDIELQVDHVYPKSKGGTDLPDNLVTACRECNIGKSDYILQLHRR